MSEPNPANDDFPLEMAREILDRMTPAERETALEEARAKGVSLEVVVLRAVRVLVSHAEHD